jgi:hypothetical protein
MLDIEKKLNPQERNKGVKNGSKSIKKTYSFFTA